MPLSKAKALLTVMIISAGISVFMPAQETSTFKVDVNIVNLLATVRDHNGRLVGDLTKEDFILEEEGKRQDITHFTKQTDLPLKIGLLIDTSRSQEKLMDDERHASNQLWDQVLHFDRDKAFIIKFDSESELLQDLTGSRRLLQDALNDLQSFPSLRRPTNGPGNSDWSGYSLTQVWPGGGIPFPGGGQPRRQWGGGRRGGAPGDQRRQQPMSGTVLFDAVYLASNEILQQQEGRKAIIIISDGVDNGSKVTEKEATEAAHHADTIIYCIRYYDNSAYNRRGGKPVENEAALGLKTLKSLSQESGGQVFDLSKGMSLKEAYAKIQEELRNQYSLGYISSNSGGSGFRRISLSTKNSKLEVTTRAGYYSKGR
jgi:VWFA-related protein